MECGEEFEQLMNHLKYKHKLTGNQYKEKYPGMKLISEEIIIKQSVAQSATKIKNFASGKTKHWAMGLTADNDERIAKSVEKQISTRRKG